MSAKQFFILLFDDLEVVIFLLIILIAILNNVSDLQLLLRLTSSDSEFPQNDEESRLPLAKQTC